MRRCIGEAATRARSTVSHPTPRRSLTRSSTGPGRYPSHMSRVIAVSGAVGGIGTSTFAYALALHAAPTGTLIDARRSGVPLELLIGGESEPGTRWHQIHVTSAAIDAETIRSALPKWNDVLFLSANRLGSVRSPALAHIVDALRQGSADVVVDVDARSSLIDTIHPDLHVLVVPNTIYGLGAAVPALRENTSLLVVRTQLEDFRSDEISRYLSQPVLGVIQHERSVWMALRARKALPTDSSVMRSAALLVARTADAA